jgi:hypothetical protein
LNSLDDHDYILTEQGTGKYADLNMVQAVALPVVAQALLTAIRARTDNGQAEAAEETTKSHNDQD